MDDKELIEWLERNAAACERYSDLADKAMFLTAASRLRELVDRNRTLAVRLAADHRFEQSPCPICDYNGEGYFKSDRHPCAAMYHAAQSGRLHVTTQGDINLAVERLARQGEGGGE